MSRHGPSTSPAPNAHPCVGLAFAADLTAVSLTLAACGAGSDAPKPQGRAAPATSPATRPSVYQWKRPHPDGIGKVYMGREIAQVMGHLGAGLLERPERER